VLQSYDRDLTGEIWVLINRQKHSIYDFNAATSHNWE
jgi:hypothetical protein